MQNQEVQQQLSETEILFSLQQFNEDMLNENFEIEEEKQRFSRLFEDLIVYSINPQQESQNHKIRNTKINQFRRRSHKIMKKQQERKRNQQSTETLLQKKQQREFNEFKQQQFKTKCITEEIYVQQGEWQEDHQIQVQEHVAIPLCYQIEDQNLINQNLNNNINININDNCIDLNNYQINNNKFQMNAYLISYANALNIPKL